MLRHSCSSGILPHNPHGLLSLLRNGLWLAQVPANFPSFLVHIFIAIPAKANPKSPKVSRNNFMLQKYTIIKDLKGAKQPENCRTYITIFNLINGHKKIGITKIHFNKTNYYSNYYNTQIGLHICFAFVFKARYLIVQSYIFANEANSTKKIHSQCFPYS